jgi:hypothetical protein
VSTAQLKRFTDASIFNIFVLGTSETVSKVMKTASDLNFVGKRYAWFALTKVRKLKRSQSYYV